MVCEKQKIVFYDKNQIIKSEKVILVVNLGTPNDASSESVKKYLFEYLTDPHVSDCCPTFWKSFLRCGFLNCRSKAACKKYEEIWIKKGDEVGCSPLFMYTRELVEKLEKKPELVNYKVQMAMRYGGQSDYNTENEKPYLSIAAAIKKLVANSDKNSALHIILVPLYPQFSTSMTGSAEDEVERALNAVSEENKFKKLSFSTITNYYTNPKWAEAVTININKCYTENSLDQNSVPLLLSYHGIPERYLTQRCDPYKYQCEESTQMIAKELKIISNISEQAPSNRLLHAYQSRFGLQKWVQPETDKVLKTLAANAEKTDVVVACPSFPIDCIETLYEIGCEKKKKYEEATGKKLYLVQSLNSTDEHVNLLTKAVEEHIADVTETGFEYRTAATLNCCSTTASKGIKFFATIVAAHAAVIGIIYLRHRRM